MKLLFTSFVFITFISLMFSFPASAETVKITPLGSHDGEFCSRDRAMLFDVGRTVASPEDSRLGKVDVVLLSSRHGDHLGDKRIAKVGDGTCAKPLTEVKASPNSNTAEIIVGKNAKAFLGGEMHKFMQTKVKAAGGSQKQVDPLRFGGERKVGGVRIAIVPVTHSNGIGSGFLDQNLGDTLKQNGLTAYAGPDNGYILTFSNGLVVYLSGDSGIFYRPGCDCPRVLWSRVSHH